MLVVALLLLLNQFTNAADPCQTPNGEQGDCVPLDQCPQLYNFFENSTITPEVARFLRRSHCGFINGNFPKVCCRTESATQPTGTLIATSDLLPKNCGYGTRGKVYGGENTDLDEFPWLVLLQYTKDGVKSFKCGGSLISKRYVLTAAHCLIPSLTSVRLGEYNTETETDCIVSKFGTDCAPKPIDVGIEDTIIYESYQKNDTNHYHDIGLIRLDQDVEFSDFIKPICLPLTTDELYKSYLGENLTVSGWGFTETGFKSNIKLKLNVPVRETSFCVSGYRRRSVNLNLDAGQMCAGGISGEDACKGDSGGPLMALKRDENKNFRLYAVGVISSGLSPCGQYNVPGIYTKVAKYVKWIVEKMKP